jgi:hypothetical protein
MAAQYCMGCGKPLPPDANFCLSCGKAVTGVPPSAPTPPTPGPPATQPGGAPPAGGQALGSVLGIEGGRNFLLQHQIISAGRNYRVLNMEKRHLFTVREEIRQEMRSNFLGGFGQQQTGFHLGPVALGTQTFLWTVADSSGNARGTISIQVTGFHAISTLVDSAGVPLLTVNVERGLTGGLTATAAFPDGRPMFQVKGNTIRHNFSIHDPSGVEVAKIHEAWASVRDTYNLDIVGSVDPLFPLVFAILIDREKGK